VEDTAKSDFAAEFEKFQRGATSFADDMKKQNIHVGMGSPAHCVTCEEVWPCSSERNK
jgi:hypothetical protein